MPDCSTVPAQEEVEAHGGAGYDNEKLYGPDTISLNVPDLWVFVTDDVAKNVMSYEPGVKPDEAAIVIVLQFICVGGTTQVPGKKLTEMLPEAGTGENAGGLEAEEKFENVRFSVPPRGAFAYVATTATEVLLF